MTRICLLVTVVLLLANSPIFSQQPEIKNLKRGKDHEIDK
jgi:HD-like signal output (HDOD) protein